MRNSRCFKQARDVGQAMAKNPVALIIPCHRVLWRPDVRLVVFSAAGGSAAKIRMLALGGDSLKAAHPAAYPSRKTGDTLARDGKRAVGGRQQKSEYRLRGDQPRCGPDFSQRLGPELGRRQRSWRDCHREPVARTGSHLSGTNRANRSTTRHAPSANRLR